MSSYTYAQSILGYCVEVLGIPRDRVQNAPREQVTIDYTNFEIETARREDWATSMIVMIPCIQVTII